MSWLIGSVFAIVAVTGLLVVLSRDPKRQVFALGANGLALTTLFFVLQAPDVGLSEIVVNTVLTPALFLMTLAAVAMNSVSR